MDLTIQLFNLLIFFSFFIICSLFLLTVRRTLSIVPALFLGILVYISTYNGLFAGLALFITALILQIR